MTVVRVDNATVRTHIENFTAQYTFPNAIKFVKDGNGNWITSVENLLNLPYTQIRQDLKQYLLSKGIVTDVDSLKKALERWGVVIDYVAPPQILL